MTLPPAVGGKTSSKSNLVTTKLQSTWQVLHSVRAPFKYPGCHNQVWSTKEHCPCQCVPVARIPLASTFRPSWRDLSSTIWRYNYSSIPPPPNTPHIHMTPSHKHSSPPHAYPIFCSPMWDHVPSPAWAWDLTVFGTSIYCLEVVHHHRNPFTKSDYFHARLCKSYICIGAPMQIYDCK